SLEAVLGGLFLGDRDSHERGRSTVLDRVPGYDALAYVPPGGELELDLEEDLLDDRAQAAGAGLALERTVGDRVQGLLGEHQLDPVELEEALELLDQGVARLGEDLHELVAAELVDRAHDREAADELGDQAVLDQVLGQAVLEDLAGVALVLGLDRGAEPNPLMADPPLDHLVELGERA